MGKFIKIQPSVVCENCIICGSRPVIDQVRGSNFVVRCPKDSTHYQTSPGLVNINDWNMNNRAPEGGGELKLAAN